MIMPEKLAIVRTVAELRHAVATLRPRRRTVGLIRPWARCTRVTSAWWRARSRVGDVPVASIFVNPTQFGPERGFRRLPRDEAGDFAKLEAAGCRIVFAPAKEDVSRADADHREGVGRHRRYSAALQAGPLRGVATVVTKLLMMAMPDRGYFGEKDYQQLQVIKTMVATLRCRSRSCMPTCARTRWPRHVIAQPLPQRQPSDGIASSSPDDGGGGPFAIVAASCTAATTAASQALLAAGFDKVEYLTVVDAESLQPLEKVTGPARIIAATRLGRTRLIDNIAVA